MKKITVAIDGFSSSGKSTMAKQLAREVGYSYIDSGAMYRAVTLQAMRLGYFSPSGEPDVEAIVAMLPEVLIEFRVVEGGVSHTFLCGEDVEREIRTLEVSNHVSPVAAIPQVRHALTAMMQQMGKRGGIVMDGRDIGTTVFPNAQMKVFVDASPEVRAERRYKELTEKGEKVSLEQVLENVRERDRIDSTRKESPLRKAPDALVLDNDHLTREEQSRWLLDTFNRLSQ